MGSYRGMVTFANNISHLRHLAAEAVALPMAEAKARASAAEVRFRSSAGFDPRGMFDRAGWTGALERLWAERDAG